MTRDNLFAYRARIANAEPLVNTRRVKIVRAGQSLNHFFWSPFTFTNHTFFSTAIFFEMFVETIYFVDKTKTSAFFLRDVNYLVQNIFLWVMPLVQVFETFAVWNYPRTTKRKASFLHYYL